ncbi:MAG TPA: glycosyltransferase family 2 protein [Candidatus Sumerlaeota bacterium]|nr:glycosyltransferase family 2 protein [Candidatus Sumerlaeota bacterium]
MTPRCSVVIITWNRRRELERALDSLFRQTIARELDIIVIDNGSNDGTVEWLRGHHEHSLRLFVFDRNHGASHGRNAGIRLARAEHVCFLDSDAEILTDDAIERCLAELQRDRSIRAVGASIWFDRARTRAFCLGGYITRDGHFDQKRTHSETTDPDFLSTCFAVWDKSLLRELRGFDPWYFWGIEDMDLSLRARWNARRHASLAATRYRIVEDVHVLHEMASGGRHYQPDNFSAAFNAYERQRLYLVLAYGGIAEFFRVLLASPLHGTEIEKRVWQKKLSLAEKLKAFLCFPLLRLIALPLNILQIRKDHLDRTPAPKEIKRP